MAVHDLAVIVVSTNERRWLGPCLSSVYEHAGGADLQAIVVDNECSDGTRELVEGAFPAAEVVDSRNGGFGYANNRGWERASARYALFLNPDTEVVHGSFGELVAALDERPEVGLAGVRQLDADGALYPSMRRFPNAGRALGEALCSERWPIRPGWAGERVTDRALYDREQRCDWTVGAFMIVRREALLSAGIMDERFFLQCEEPDLCLRIARAGWEVRHLPTMTIVHHAGKAGRDPRMAAQDAYARCQYARKHFGAAHRALYVAAIATRHAARSVLPGADRELARGRRRAARRALRTVLRRSEAPFCQPPPAALWIGPPAGPGVGSARQAGPGVSSAPQAGPARRAAPG